MPATNSIPMRGKLLHLINVKTGNEKGETLDVVGVLGDE
jgi:hypothetical protein